MRTSIIAAAAILTAALPAAAAELSARTNYILRCTGCHGMDGTGSPVGGIPDFVNLVGAFAGEDDGRTYVLHVPGVAGAGLSDAETAAVLNYVMGTFGGTSLPANYTPFTTAEVVERQARPVANVVQLRRTLAARLRDRGVELAGYPWP